MRWIRTVAAAALVLTVAACGGAREGGGESGQYSGGRLSIATGNTTGVYYQLGGGYADLINRYIPGYTATAEIRAQVNRNMTAKPPAIMRIPSTM